MKLDILEDYVQKRRTFLRTTKLIKQLEEKILEYKRLLPTLKTQHHRAKKLAYEECDYALTGDKTHIYAIRKKKDVTLTINPRCLERYFLPVVETLDSGDLAKNNEFIRYFLDTWLECDCSKIKNFDGIHRCTAASYRRDDPEHHFRDLYRAENSAMEEYGNFDIHVIVSERHNSYIYWYLLPPKCRTVYTNGCTVYTNTVPTCNLICSLNHGDKNVFTPWKIEPVWDWLVETHRQKVAAKRIQRMWRFKRTG